MRAVTSASNSITLSARDRHVDRSVFSPMTLLRFALALAAPLLAFAEPARPLLLDAERRSPTAFAAEVKKALAAPILTVVAKPKPSPTGDAHDYVSYARYWWPDPARPDGLPYVRKDGHHNHERVAAGDNDHLWKFAQHVSVLALAWARDHREEDARRAGEWLRAWFVTPATRMKPALDYAQVRLGHDGNRGSPSGVLDARQLAWVADAVRVLDGSPALNAEESRAVRGVLSLAHDGEERAQGACGRE
jgi:hypothetical protein